MMPRLMLRLLLTDLHHMFTYFEQHGGNQVDAAEFRKVVPDALTAEDWFRFHNRCAPAPPPPPVPTACAGARGTTLILIRRLDLNPPP